MGLFTRPRRSVLSTLDRARGNDRIVYSERELRAAITDALTTGIEAPHRSGAVTYTVRWATFRIIIGGAIKLTDTVTIPRDLNGLEIIGSRATPVTVSSDVDVVFDVRGEYATLEGLTLRDLSGSTVTATTAFRVVGYFARVRDCVNELATNLCNIDGSLGASGLQVPEGVRVLDCEGGSILYSRGSKGNVISGCAVNDVSGVTNHLHTDLVINGSVAEGDFDLLALKGGRVTDVTVEGDASLGVYLDDGLSVSGCDFLGTLVLSGGTEGVRLTGVRVVGGVTISIAGTACSACNFESTVSARANNVTIVGGSIEGAVAFNWSGISYCSLIGVALNGQNYTSTASAGFHTVVGNTNAGTITAHGNDQVANNT